MSSRGTFVPGAVARRGKAAAGHAAAGRALSSPPLTWFKTAMGVGLAAAVLALPVVASAESCPNTVFRNGPSSRLPDCRAYEMVSPVYKQGFPVTGLGISEDGSGVFGTSLGNFAGTEVDQLSLAYFNNDVGESGFDLGASYLFSRGESGWAPTAIGLPVSQYPRSVTFMLNPDMTESLSAAVSLAHQQAVESAGGVPVQNYPSSFYVRSSNGPIVEVGPIAPLSPQPPAEDNLYFQGVEASSDLSHVVFALTTDFWPSDETKPDAESLYEDVGTGDPEPMLVGVRGGPGSKELISRCGTGLGSQFASVPGSIKRVGREAGAVSSTGAVIYFTARACEGTGAPAVDELYARVDSGQGDAHTVAISEPSRGDCVGCDTEAGVLAGAHYQGASADGSKVFFTTTQPLLGGDSSNNLYEYDFEGEAGQRIARVSSGDSTVSNPVGSVEHVVSVSPDGSLVYFTAGGVLTETPNVRGEKAQAGQSNLYLYERDSGYPGGRTVFILPTADLTVYPGDEGSNEGLEQGEPEVSLSQSDRFLAFESYVHLTPDTLGPAIQVFEYDSQTGDFARISIGQSGFNHNGNTGSIAAILRVRVADDGAAFFDSSNPLVPQAVSGQQEIYEYHAGSVSLVSDGQDTFGSELVGITPSGSNVFFQTQDRLVPRDTDAQEDIYDARIDGGFNEPPSPPQCEGDACQGVLGGAPVLLSPGSEFQAGGENTTPVSTTPVAERIKLKSKPKKAGKKAKKKRPGRRGAKKATRRVGR